MKILVCLAFTLLVEERTGLKQKEGMRMLNRFLVVLSLCVVLCGFAS